MEFHAVRLLVNDFQKSLSFYRDVLGFSEWHNDEQEYAYFEKQQLALFSHLKIRDVIGEEQPTNEAFYSKFLLQFEVDNVDETYRGLVNKGVRFINLPHDQVGWGSRVVHLRDPEGNVIELYQILKKEKG
ncbi:glyoxalase superfamily protein [Margalitia sp. FSL K6-0131]|uniref:glyoxalase superfamily protein n=1 Tax=Margalitia sp. FSL K6-0131 TaxID=2954604 RepID=UPI0030FC0202